MSTYRSKPTECEAMAWDADGHTLHYNADKIVAWVNDNEGEARYEAAPCPYVHGEDCWAKHEPRIASRTINGWAYAAPGHYVVMGTAWFPKYTLTGRCRDFYPCDPETFESRWELAR